MLVEVLQHISVRLELFREWKPVMEFLDFFFFSSRRLHTRFDCDWSSDMCSSDLGGCRRCSVRTPTGATSPLGSAVLYAGRHCECDVDDCIPASASSSRAFGKRSREAGIWGIADRKSTRLNSSHSQISYAVFCLRS